jgi:hypothetical protein
MFRDFRARLPARRRVAVLFLLPQLALLPSAATALAQTAPESPPSTPPADPVPPQAPEPTSIQPAPDLAALQPAASPPAEAPTDLSAIEAALARDAASSAGTPPTPSASPSSAAGAPQSMNPDLALIADFALAAFSPNSPHQTGDHDPQEPGFNLQQLELSFGAAVDPYFRFDSNIVFSLEGVEVEEAYATTLDLPFRLQARFGQMLTRFGRLNPTHPHVWDFVDQPFALGRIFGGEGNRGLGVELSYLTPLPWYVELVASGTRADGEGTARSFFGAENPGVGSPRDLLYVTAIKQFFPLSDDLSLFWGLSGAFGPNARGADRRTEVYGTDLYLKYRPISRENPVVVSLQSEWLYRHRQLETDSLHDTSGYAQALYRFAQRWSTAVRYEFGSPSYDASGGRVSDELDPDWTRARQRWSLALTHYPTEFSRFRLQGSRDAGLGEPVWAVFLAAEVATGAHGAHSF